MQVMFPSSTLPSKMVLPEVSVCVAIGTTTGSLEVVCVMGATIVFGEVLLLELYCRITHGRSLHSSLPIPTPNLQRYTCPLVTILVFADGFLSSENFNLIFPSPLNNPHYLSFLLISVLRVQHFLKLHTQFFLY